jgi:hypothetical protein
MQVLNNEITHPLLLEKQYGILAYEIKHFMHDLFDSFPGGFAEFAILDKPLTPPQFKNKSDRKLSTLKDQVSGLTRNDIEFMELQSQSRKDFYWNNLYLPEKQLLSHDFIKGILSLNDPWRYIHDQVGTGFCAFSLPLLTQNRRQVFIEYAFYRDSICGIGGFITYILDVGRKWKEMSITLCKNDLPEENPFMGI